MTIPKQVEEAATLATELHSQMFGGEEELPSEETAEEEKPDLQVVEDTQKEEPPAEKLDTGEPPLEEEEVNWEARFKTLKGKYDAEVPRLHDDLKELKDRVFEKLGNVSKQEETVVEEPVSEEEKTRLERVALFKEQYGEDYVGMLKDFMLEEFGPMLKQSVEPVAEKVASVEETQHATAQEKFLGYIDENVKGNWRDAWVNNDPDFMAYLDQPDPTGLMTLRELANTWNEEWNGEKLVKLFNNYFEAKAPATPVKEPVAQTPVADPTAMIAPTRNTPHTTPAEADSESRIWTQDMIREFERNDRQNKYDKETSEKLWADLLSAPSQNRVRS